MRPRTSHPVDLGKLIQGALVVLVGILCWLYQAGHLSLTQLLAFWPLALVGVGLCDLAERRPEPVGRRSGWGWLLAGGLLLVGNQLTPEEHVLEIWLGIFPLRVSWPMLLVVAGSYIAWRERLATPERG